MLAAHVPLDDDEWLLFETSKLTEFTRLFPPLKSSASTGNNVTASTASLQAAGGDTADTEGQDGEEAGNDEEDGGAKSMLSKAGRGEKFKPAPYNEIICQVCDMKVVDCFHGHCAIIFLICILP